MKKKHFTLIRGFTWGFIFFLPIIWLASCSNSQTDFLAKEFEGFSQNGALSGVLLVNKRGGKTVYSYGLANDCLSVPNAENTTFLIASISKSFVAASIMKLVEQGRLTVSDPISKWLPEYPSENLKKKGVPATLRSLLNHTSGIPEGYLIPEIEEQLDRKPLSFLDFVNPIEKLPLHFLPQTKFEYSNTGYLILGEIIKRASGKFYHDFLKENFLAPAQLNSITVGPGLDLPAIPYVSVEGKRVSVLEQEGIQSVAASDLYADTNIYSNVNDLNRWIDNILEGKLLSPKTTQEVLAPGLGSYGYGWYVFEDENGRKTIEHAGSYKGFQSWVRKYPNQ